MLRSPTVPIRFGVGIGALAKGRSASLALNAEIRQKGSTNEAAAPLQSFFVLQTTPGLAERWMQKGSTKQVGALRPLSVWSAEAQQEGITN